MARLKEALTKLAALERLQEEAIEEHEELMIRDIDNTMNSINI